MSDPRWFEEKPSKEMKNRIEHAADEEFKRRDSKTRTAKAESRRGLLSIFSFDVLSAGAVAGVAGVLGFWLTGDKQHRHALQASEDADLIDDSLEANDIEFVAEIEFLEDLEILESLKDEELNA